MRVAHVSGSRWQRSMRAALAGVSLLAWAAAFEIRPATAQATSAPAQTVAVSVSAGSLEGGLLALGRQANLRLLYPSALTRGRETAGVSGRLSPHEAVARLLAGTGLRYTFTGANTVRIFDGTTAAAAAVGPAPEGAVVLDTIDVQGGGTQGFVARSSSVGTKTNTPLIETPQSISVVTRAQMDEQNTQSVAEALRYTPGVMSEYRGTVTRYDLPYIRGYGGLSPTQYLDGMRMPVGSFAMPQISQNGLERIEVLRGPASVLYGQNLPGGLINLVSKRPPLTTQRTVEVEAGSRGAGQAAFDFGGPIDSEGRFLYRLTGLASRADGQIDFTKQERVDIGPSLTWRPNADTTLTILSGYQNDPYGGYFGFLPASGTVFANPYGRIPRTFFDGDPSHDKFTRRQYQIGYIFDHQFNDAVRVHSALRYQHIDSVYESVFGQGLAANKRTLMRSAMDSYESFGALTTDNNMQVSFGTGPLQHEALVGFDYTQSRLDQVRYYGATKSLDIVNPVYYQLIPRPPLYQSIIQTQEQIGTYAQDQIKLGRLSLVAGAREDWASTDTRNQMNSTTASQFDRAFTWRTGAVYLFDNGIAPYASYTESFSPVPGTDRLGIAFRPTTADQYEAGVKFQPLGWNAFITLAAFDITQRNVVTADPTNSLFRVQTGEVRTRGFEAEFKASLADGWNLLASYTYLDPENTRANGGLQGKEPVLIPHNMASAWASYTFNDTALRGLDLGVGVRYVGSTFGDALNTFKVPPYTLVDAVIRYDLGASRPQLKGWTVSINATNLLDKTYVSGCTYAGGCYYGLGRTVLGKIRYDW